MDAAEWVAVITALGGVFTGVGFGLRYLLEWYLKRRDQKTGEADKRSARLRTERADAIQEWKDVSANIQTRLDHMTAEVLRLHEARVEDARQHAEVRAEWERKHGECQKETALLNGHIQLLTAATRRLQAITGDEAPGSTAAVTINADLDGVIRSVSPSVGPVLHWAPADLIRKNVDVLMPERLRVQHREAIRRLRESGSVPWPEKTLVTYALTSAGAEVPVAVNLTAWQTGGGLWMISADVRRRSAMAAQPAPQEG